MTRDEAYRVAERGYGTTGNFNTSPRAFVDMAAALGMLKLDEPKSVDERIELALKASLGVFLTRAEREGLRAHLAERGLKIVEK